ncbi:LysR family transcriptional regulator [Streptomyces abyssalis]|uniref:LysR family transcriptional regulator n=1 Tax=Streptomyces abyssalis TaxID=933944 RepID=A0A1E7JSX6_9ACTN|nr:LysR family transcriptional regulator [Streptomyces abyssalis]OEU92005.1 LysR family transcriptional regulator [Streptomyces abyssalis]OEU94717.1 LysR family transcriptional regulator [Streptomyces abyssalis]
MLSVTLRQLDYLVAVAEHGTVTAAAQALHLSQSTVSTAIADLEHILKISLFVRHPRGLSLTRDGEMVLAEARRLLRDAASLERRAAGLSGELAGELHIGCYSTIAPLLLPAVVTEFMLHYPAVDVNFSEGSQHVLLEQMDQGRSDVAVMYAYRFRNHLTDLGHTATKLTAVPPYVLLHPEHRLAQAESIALRDLAEDPYILFDLEPGGQYFLSVFDAEGVNPDIRFRTPNSELVRCLVARGAGYSLLSQRPKTTVSYEGLPYVTKELSARHEGLDVVAVTPGDRVRSKRVVAFIEMAVGLLRP